jgi:hypothetical protein
VQKLISFKGDSTNSIMQLEGEEQLTLGSFDQFLLVNINLYTLPICNLHIFKFINILTKEKILSVSIWGPIISKISHVSKTIVENKNLCFPHHSKAHSMFLYQLGTFRTSTIFYS